MKKIIISLVTASLILIAGCHSGSGDPKTVLISFFDALTKKDIEAAKKLSTKSSEALMSMIQMGMQNVSDTADMSKFNKNDMEFGDAVISGDVATVPVKEKSSGETVDFTLKKEDGAWKVAFDKSTLMGMAQKKMKEHNFNMDNMKIDSADMEKAGKMLDQMKDSVQ